MCQAVYYNDTSSVSSSPSSSTVSTSSSSLIDRAASELESVRRCRQTTTSLQQQQQQHEEGVHFPPHCRKLLHSLPGNTRCVDCGARNPDWASVSYGTLLCVNCSGRHRSYGVRTSFVRSLSMDTWSHEQILAMLEGGNEQLCRFFERHEMLNEKYYDDVSSKRYFTKAAHFYRVHLAKHAQALAQNGMYQGREASRQCTQSPTTATAQSSQAKTTNSTTNCRVVSPTQEEEQRDTREATRV